MPSLSTRQLFWLLIVIFVISRAFLFSLESDKYLQKFPFQDDAPAYLNIARVYLGTGSFEQYNLTPYTRTPLYPLFLTMFLIHPTTALPAVLFSQQLISALTIALVFWFLIKHHSRSAAIVTTLLLIFFFDFCLYGFLIRNEIIFSAWLLLGTLCYLQLWSSAHLYWPLLAGLSFGLSVLTRPISFLIFLPLLLPLVLSVAAAHFTFKRALIISALFLLAFFIPVTPWLTYNYFLTQSFVLQLESSIVHATFPGGHYQAYNVADYIDTAGKSPLAIDQSLFSLALHRIKAQPKIWLANSWQNFTWRLWSLGFTDTHLRYFGYLPADGGYHHGITPLWQRWLSSINLFSRSITINPFYHFYFILNNLLGFSLLALSLLSLIIFPFFPFRSQIIYLVIFYFWLLLSFFQFSGSRLILPVIPLFFMILPDFPAALLRFIHRPPQPPHNHARLHDKPEMKI